MSPALIGSLSAALCCLIVMIADCQLRSAHERSAWRQWYHKNTDMIIGTNSAAHRAEGIL